jgi:hypothetical protein
MHAQTSRGNPVLYVTHVFKNSNHLFSFKSDVELNDRREREKVVRGAGMEASFVNTALHR